MASLEDAARALASLGRAASSAVAGSLGAAERQARLNVRALPAGSPQNLPYTAVLILADLGTSPDVLTSRTVKRIMRSFPVPTGHRLIWADVELGTRSHGLLLTDRGLFIKDGAPDPDSEDVLDDPTVPMQQEAFLSEDGLEVEGLGYHYLAWDGFDAARVSHKDGWPTLDGELLTDGPRFRRLAAACVRISNQRVRSVRAGRQFARQAGCLSPNDPVRPVYRFSPSKTTEFCFDSDQEYRFYTPAPQGINTDLVDVVDQNGARLVPVAVEVPADQFDVVLRRMRARIEKGDVPGIFDVRAAGALVRRGRYTFAQAQALAAHGIAAEVEVSEKTGSVLFAPPASVPARGGLTRVLDGALHQRAQALATVAASQDLATLAQAAPNVVGQLLAQGEAQARSASSGDKEKVAKGAARMAADQVAVRAGYAVGATGARVLLSAAGLAAGPLSLVAGMALGDITARAGTQAFSMARDLVVEPRSRVLWRLMQGVLWHLMDRAAFLEEERTLLLALLVSGALREEGAAALVALGERLFSSVDQEQELHAFLIPLIDAVRKISR